MVILGPLSTSFSISSESIFSSKKKSEETTVATSFGWGVVLGRGGTMVGERIITVYYSLIFKFNYYDYITYSKN